MEIKRCNQQKKMLKLKEELFAVEKDRLSGKKDALLMSLMFILTMWLPIRMQWNFHIQSEKSEFSLSGGEWSENLGGNTKIPVGDWKID